MTNALSRSSPNYRLQVSAFEDFFEEATRLILALHPRPPVARLAAIRLVCLTLLPALDRALSFSLRKAALQYLVLNYAVRSPQCSVQIKRFAGRSLCRNLFDRRCWGFWDGWPWGFDHGWSRGFGIRKSAGSLDRIQKLGGTLQTVSRFRNQRFHLRVGKISSVATSSILPRLPTPPHRNFATAGVTSADLPSVYSAGGDADAISNLSQLMDSLRECVTMTASEFEKLVAALQLLFFRTCWLLHWSLSM